MGNFFWLVLGAFLVYAGIYQAPFPFGFFLAIPGGTMVGWNLMILVYE